MQLGVIGLGRMGANMVRRLIRKSHNGAAPQVPISELGTNGKAFQYLMVVVLTSWPRFSAS
jgi:6-phosphogluconate dehydrogenase (decarboxylating)